MRLFRLAYLAHLPECDFDFYGAIFSSAKAADRIREGAFSSIEGAFLKGFLKTQEIDLHAISFSRFVSKAQVLKPAINFTIYLLPAHKFTGMLAGWRPRAWRVRKLLYQIKPDMVHGMRNIEGYGFIAATSGFPHAVTYEEFLSGIPFAPHLGFSMILAKHTETFVVRNSQNNVAISQHVKKGLIERGALGHIPVIPNIAADEFFFSEKRSPKYFLYVGRITPEKGLIDIIRALASKRCRKMLPRMLIVGAASGPYGKLYLEECKKAARELLHPSQVLFMGPMQSAAIAKLHEEALALIMPSTAKYEGMGVVIAEALAAGTPVITYNFGPMPELVIDGKTGRIVQVADIESLAEAISFFCQSQTISLRMQDACRKTAQKYSKENVCLQYIDLFRKIVNEQN